MQYQTAKPYIASYLLFRKAGKIAFVLRANTSWMNGYYGLPSGKVEEDESYTAAAAREAKEEVGVDVSISDLKFVHVMHRKEESYWVDVFFEASKWRGELRNAEPQVHGELKWFEINDLPENTVPFVRSSLDYIGRGIFYSEYGWVN